MQRPHDSRHSDDPDELTDSDDLDNLDSPDEPDDWDDAGDSDVQPNQQSAIHNQQSSLPNQQSAASPWADPAAFPPGPLPAGLASLGKVLAHRAPAPQLESDPPDGSDAPDDLDDSDAPAAQPNQQSAISNQQSNAAHQAAHPPGDRDAPDDLDAPAAADNGQRTTDEFDESDAGRWTTDEYDFLRRKRIYDRFRVSPAWDAAIAPTHLYPWIVENVAQAGRITLVVGDAAAKKTYAMLHLALHVSLGLPWLGHPTLQTPVLYMEEDLGGLAVNHRLALLNRGLRRRRAPAVHIASQNYWNFPDPAEADLLLDLLRDLGVRLVILDPLIHLSPWNVESVSRPLVQTIRLLRNVAENARAAVVIVHHLNKRGVYRGVSHLKGLVDSMLLVRSHPNSPVVHFETHKLRDAQAADFAAFMHVQPPGPHPDFIQFLPYSQSAGFNPLKVAAPEAILHHLAFHGPASRRALLAALPAHKPRTIHQALHRLVKDRQVFPTSGVPALYRLHDSEAM
ncbi:MAG: AAA family ATPase [Chloroflexi bacterium]|nr:AAA family ATPase [Chloroflexota bacterium]